MINESKSRPSGGALTFCADTVIGLLPLIAVAACYYGARVILMCLLSLATALAAKLTVCLLRQREVCAADLYCVNGALAIALFCPPAVPHWIPMLGSVLLVAARETQLKFIGRDTFCSSAFALAVLFLLPVSRMSYYTVPGEGLNLISTPAVERSASVLQSIEWGRIPAVDWLELLLGRYGGPMGTTALSVLIICIAYICIRRPRTLWTVLPYMATLAVFGLMVVRAGSSRLMSALFETAGGSALFCSVFVAAQPGCMPSTAGGRALSGAAMGVLTMLLRYFGLCESSCIYALLLCSLFAQPADRLAMIIKKRLRRTA